MTIKSYMNKYASDCNNDGVIDCEDFAIIHRVGPNCANNNWLKVTDYWNAFTETVCSKKAENSGFRPSGSAVNSITITDKNHGKMVPKECLKCICEASSNCNLKQQCFNGHCGPYLISQKYWIDGGKLGSDHVQCTTNKTCAERSIQNYMLKYYKDCNNDGIVDCDDFAAIHKLGPDCNSQSLYFSEYWKHFEYCSVMEPTARRELPPVNFYTYIRRPTEGNRVVTTSTSKPKIKKFNFPKYTVKPIKLTKQFSNLLVDVSEGCLECICEASSGCQVSNFTSCENDQSACGVYQIDKVYWAASGRYGYRGAANDFERCAKNKQCAGEIVRRYLSKHAFDCNRDGHLNCVDFVLIHKKGPKYCADKDIFENDYWYRFESCYGFSR
ncbi:Destabilase-like protein [Dinothrombium tinctorium]|uniref:lysozyme n=1 Tax=Dinothrombium tinctorium TaxID=1965070 RepID=A0A443RB68_9ACAR|nr:Destabilase-like protein [Dinothrombium tinctorium]